MPRRWPDSALVLARWALTAVLAGTITFTVDRGWIAVFRPRVHWRWIHDWTLWGGHVLLATLVVALGLASYRAARALPSTMQGGKIRAAALAGAIAFVVLLWPLAVIGTSLAAGAWISEQWFAFLVVAAPVIAGIIGAPLAFFIALPTDEPRPWRRRALIMVIAVAIGILVNVDHYVSPGLFPGFHLIVETVTTVATVVGLTRLLAEVPTGVVERWTRIGTAVGILGCVAGAALWLGMADGTRAALLLRSPIARTWIRHAMPQRPSTLLRETLADIDVHADVLGETPVPAVVELARDPDWNIVLVVADTMRADAVPPVRPTEGTDFAWPGDTPRIDAWLGEAHRFEFAYSPATETKRAMPAMFRSIDVSDDPRTMGIALGDRMERLGKRPMAVVHRYFMPAKYPEIAELLDGFDDIRVYENPTTDSAVPQALKLAASAGEAPFMLFVHLYTLHVPGFAGTVLGPEDGTRIEKYRRALTYLDGQFGALLDGLDSLGLRDRTIVVLVGDHGEGLGDHGQTLHGPNVFDEDVRVPLAFEIPGRDGRTIHETVGTIDLVPTLVDLLGAAPFPADRGRSLVPLFVGEPREPERPYYFENSDASTVGVVIGRDKLIYEQRVDVAYRFDVGTDPDELDDRHDSRDPVYRRLSRVLVEYKPEIAASELEDTDTLALLGRRLAEVDPAAPGSSLRLLVRLVALAPRPELLDRCAEIFRLSDDVAVKLLMARYLIVPAAEQMSPLVVEWLDGLAGRPEELDTVAMLANQGQTEFAPEAIGRRLGWFAHNADHESWAPWLQLVRPWAKPSESFARPLAQMVLRARSEEIPSATLEILLENVATLQGTSRTTRKLVSDAIHFLAHPEPRVRAAAMRVMGALGDERVRKRVVKKLLEKREDIRVRREAAVALTALAGDEALPDLAKAANESAMTALVVRHLRDHGSAEAIPVLEKIHLDSKGDTRIEARMAIEQITARTTEEVVSTTGE